MIYQNRAEAGKTLAQKLKKYKNKEDVLVLALPRGGVPVAAQIAKTLNAPLDIFVIRKIGAPHNPELAIGAVGPEGVWYLDKLAIESLRIPRKELNLAAIHEVLEVKRRQKEYRGRLPQPAVQGKTIILVDDGIATGATVKTAVRALRKKQPAKIILAVPLCSQDVEKELKIIVDEFICLEVQEEFIAVSGLYKDFSQVSDREVTRILAPYLK